VIVRGNPRLLLLARAVCPWCIALVQSISIWDVAEAE